MKSFEKQCGQNMAGKRYIPSGAPRDRARGGQARRERKPPAPLDAAGLEARALAYVARYATSAAKLEHYLARKLRERGWEGEGEPPVEALVARFVELGYIDERAFAEARSNSLLRRGYGPRRIGQTLGAAGIGEDLREAVKPDDAARRQAALAMARKRRFGPFGAAPLDRPVREKQIAAMLRAGHILDDARAVLGAANARAAQDWAAGNGE